MGHTWTADGGSWRVNVDPGPLGVPLPFRLPHQWRLAEQLLQETGAGRWTATHRTLWETLLPPGELARMDARFGAWLTLPSAGTGGGLRVYYSLAAYRRRFETLTDFWLAALQDLPVPHLHGVIAALPCGRGPAMLGAEYHPVRPLTAKWYVRPCDAVHRDAVHDLLDAAGLPRHRELDTVLDLWTDALHTFPRGTLLYYLSADETGRRGVNVYLDLRRLGRTGPEIRARVTGSLRALHLWQDADGLDWSSDPPGLSGLGFRDDGVRVNQYFEPARLPAAREWSSGRVTAERAPLP